MTVLDISKIREVLAAEGEVEEAAYLLQVGHGAQLLQYGVNNCIASTLGSIV